MLRLVLPKGSLEAGDPAAVRGRRPRGRARLRRRLPGHDRRPARRRRAILRPQEIPRYVADGLFDVGITGRDWIEETSADVVTLTELHYSKATARPIRMVLAVAADSPDRVGRPTCPPGVRVHTEYPELTRRYFEKHGVDAEVSLSYGATEAKIPDIADAVVEITETGRALRAAGLRSSTRSSCRYTELIANPRRVRRSRRSARRWSSSRRCSAARSRRAGACW